MKRWIWVLGMIVLFSWVFIYESNFKQNFIEGNRDSALINDLLVSSYFWVLGLVILILILIFFFVLLKRKR